MADDNTALIVALSAQIDKFEKAMLRATQIADKQVQQIEQRFDKMNTVLASKFDELRNRAQGAAGFTGQVLSSLGPAGVAAAVGIGGFIIALNKASELATELATKAREIRNLAAETGLTTDQFQALSGAAGKVGVSSEELSGFVTKLTVNLDQLRRGGGDLADQLRRIPGIGPKLLDDLSVARTTAEAITILGRAYANLDTVQKNALSRAIGGRGGAGALSRLLPGLDVDEITKSAKEAGKVIDEELINKLAKLQSDIERTSKAFNKNLALIFSEDVLSAQLRYLQQLEAISKIAREFGISAGLRALLETKEVGTIATLLRAVPGVGGAIRAAATVSPFLPSSNTPVGAAPAISLPSPESLAKLDADLKKIKDDMQEAALQSDIMSQKMAGFSLKGKTEEAEQAASAAQKWSNRVEKLGEDYDRLSKKRAGAGSVPAVGTGLGTVAGANAIAGAALDQTPQFKLEEFQRFISILGEAATPAQILQLQLLKLNAAIADNPRYANAAAQAEAALRLAHVASAVAIKERLGVATQDELALVKRAQLADAVAKGIVTGDTNIATAERIIRLEAQKTAEALQVRASKLPQLTQFAQDAQNSFKQFDQLGVNSLNAFGDAVADVALGTKTLSEAFRDMTNSIIRDLIKIAVRQAITGPIAAVLGFGTGGGGLLGGLFGGIGKNAEGTNSWRGGPTWVGEKGPEIINLPKGSQVIPNAAANAAMSGGGSTTLALTVRVEGARGNTEIQQMVMTGVRAGLSAYDRNLLNNLTDKQTRYA